MWKWMVLPLTAGLVGCASSSPPPVTQTSYANPAPDIAPKPEKAVEPAPKKASQCRVFSDHVAWSQSIMFRTIKVPRRGSPRKPWSRHRRRRSPGKPQSR